ncbi:MAG: gamma-glutamylcyclotransferase family protein [Pseudomonadota bacterium]
MVPRIFFFYGTLLPGLTGVHANFIEPFVMDRRLAHAKGRIFAISDERGTYPALLSDAADSYSVHGEIYSLSEDFGTDQLARLDRYEEYFVNDERRSEYIRKPLPCRLGDGANIIAEAYVYNWDLPSNATPIPSGDFTEYLRITGLRPYTQQ